MGNNEAHSKVAGGIAENITLASVRFMREAKKMGARRPLATTWVQGMKKARIRWRTDADLAKEYRLLSSGLGLVGLRGAEELQGIDDGKEGLVEDRARAEHKQHATGSGKGQA